MENLLDIPAHAGPAFPEYFEALLAGPRGLLLERIISHGHSTPPGEWYDQGRDEWVLLLEGEAVLAFEDGSSIALGKGGHVFLPRHVKHRVAFTSAPCVWLALHGEDLSAAER